MKTLVVFYSYTGSAERYAKTLAGELNAKALCVRDAKRPGTLAAYTAGCFRALRGVPSPIQPLEEDLNNYDQLALVAPVWAGNPAPPFNAVVAALPAGKSVEVYLVSASGHSSNADKIKETIEKKGCHVTSYQDVKASAV